MSVFLAVTPAEAASCRGYRVPLVHIAYAVGDGGRLLRSELPRGAQGGLLGLSDRCNGPLPELLMLCRAILGECHAHRFGGVQRAGGTVYAWPGCMEGRGFDETGEKGVLLADVAAGDVQVQFLPVPGRRYEILRVDVTDADPVQAVLAALPEGAARNIFRIVLTGETDRAPNPAALRAALEGQVFAMQLRDETRARRDLWARAGEGTLRGQFLAQLKQKYDAADSDRDRETIVMAARWGLAALDHDEEVVTL